MFEAASNRPGLRVCCDWLRGLRDPSAVIRYKALRDLPTDVAVPGELAKTLLEDPDAAVRELAGHRLP